jgi:hypothetical protein
VITQAKEAVAEENLLAEADRALILHVLIHRAVNARHEEEIQKSRSSQAEEILKIFQSHGDHTIVKMTPKAKAAISENAPKARDFHVHVKTRM